MGDGAAAQFHDILPGSSIAWVHADAERNHAAITAGATEIIEAALAALTGAGETAGGRQRRPARADRGARPGCRGRPTTVDASAATRVSTEGDLVVLDNGIIRAAIDRARTRSSR